MGQLFTNGKICLKRNFCTKTLQHERSLFTENCFAQKLNKNNKKNKINKKEQKKRKRQLIKDNTKQK